VFIRLVLVSSQPFGIASVDARRSGHARVHTEPISIMGAVPLGPAFGPYSDNCAFLGQNRYLVYVTLHCALLLSKPVRRVGTRHGAIGLGFKGGHWLGVGTFFLTVLDRGNALRITEFFTAGNGFGWADHFMSVWAPVKRSGPYRPNH